MSEISTESGSDQSESQNYLQDPQASALMSRLAALQGHSVPAFRFGMLDQTTDGRALSDLLRWQSVMERWAARFPEAVPRVLQSREIVKNDFPLIWVSEDGAQVLLLRGKFPHGTYNAENAEGQSFELDEDACARGVALCLRVTLESGVRKEDLPKTATEWFVFSLKRYRGAFTDSVLATFIISLVGVTAAMYSMQVYDRVVPTKGYETLIVLTLGVALAMVMELALKMVRTHMVERACRVIDQELSAVFFGKALDIRLDARPKTIGTFASQIRHFESVRNFMTASTLFVLADAPFAMFFVLVIAFIAPPVALVPLVIVPLSLLLGWASKGRVEKITEMHMAESNQKNGVLIEAIDGIESIKASNAEWKVLERWRQLVASIADSELRMRSLSALTSNMTLTLQQVNYVGMVVVGAYLIMIGELTMGGLIACTIISGRALNPLAQIPGLIVQWKHAQIALKGLDSIMALPNDRDHDVRLIVPERCHGLIHLDKVAFGYGQGSIALEVPGLTIKPGERVAIMGSVGSGKSTLIKIISGLFRPTQGLVTLDGVDVTQLAPEFVRESIGYLPQDVRLFQGTLRDNLILGLPLPSDTQILKAAATTGLDQIIKNHPKGLELEITEGGKGLSGGQRQLVGLTRLLLAQPKVMLLDEPTASMDMQLEALVMRHLFEGVPKDSAVVVVTHKPALLPLVTRLILVDKGRIVMDGPRDEVIAKLKAMHQDAAQKQAQMGQPAGVQKA